MRSNNGSQLKLGHLSLKLATLGNIYKVPTNNIHYIDIISLTVKHISY